MADAARLDALNLRHGSLPKARQWLEWLGYWGDALPQDDGWERLLRDTLVGLHHGVANAARRLRKNPGWDLQGTMKDDTEPLEDAAQLLLRRLEAASPRTPSGYWTRCPERFQKPMDCLYGAVRQQVRLAREIDQMRLAGRIEVSVQVDEVNTAALEQ